MSDLRVCFVEAYPCFRGAQRSLAALAQSLVPSLDVNILCTVDGPCVAGFEAAGLSPRLVEVPRPLRSFGGVLAGQGAAGTARTLALGVLPYAGRLARRFARERPDVVHCNQARGVLLAAPAARLLGIPVVWHLRGRNTFRGAIERALYGLADRILCVSHAVQESLGVGGRAKSRVVPNGISVSYRPSAGAVAAVRRRIARQRLERGLTAGGLTLVTASSFVPYKGLHRLVEGLALLLRERPELSRQILWIALGDAGDDAQRRYLAALERRIDDAGIRANVWLPGWQQQALDWIAAADLTVLPTIERERFDYGDGGSTLAVCSEGFPRTILESMVVGTPVLASDVAGVTEQIVDGESGLVVAPGRASELAERIGGLVRRPRRLEELAAAAERRVRRFSIEAMRDGVLADYRTFMKGGS